MENSHMSICLPTTIILGFSFLVTTADQSCVWRRTWQKKQCPDANPHLFQGQPSQSNHEENYSH